MLFFIICASISLTLATPENNVYPLEEAYELFETFIKEHNKQYEVKEKEDRFQIFLDNLKEINSLNEKSSKPVFGITQFSDLTKDEFIQTYTGFKRNKDMLTRRYGAQLPQRFNYTAPDEFDWRTKGVVSRVKDQRHCGSCWAFSVTGNVESINAIKTGKIVEISEQQLVDCTKKCHGCCGGDIHYALSYLVENGVMSSKSYPYEDKYDSCRFDSDKIVLKLSTCEHYQIQEADIKELLYINGPLSIVIDGTPLQNYNGNHILHIGCDSKKLNHAVLLVGYGQENGVDYWIVKNSWSERWGDYGYFRMKRGVNCLNINEYGVATAFI